MALQDISRRAGPFSWASNRTYTFGFKVFSTSQVEVTVLRGTTETVLTSSLYTVTLNADQENQPGGTVVLANGVDTADKVAITSAVPYTQEMELTNQGGFYPDILNSNDDRIVAQIQQLKEGLARAIKVGATSSTSAEAYKADLETTVNNAASDAETAAAAAEAAQDAAEAAQGAAEDAAGDAADALDDVTTAINGIPGVVSDEVDSRDIPGQVSTAVTNQDIPLQVATAVSGQDIPGQVAAAVTDEDIPGQVATAVTNAGIPGLVSTAVTNADIPGQVSTAVTNADIPGQVATAVAAEDVAGQVATAVTNADIPGLVEDEVTEQLTDQLRETVETVVGEVLDDDLVDLIGYTPADDSAVVKHSSQSLTDAQKAQARTNIGAQAALTFDSTPTANSTNPVTSDGVKTAVDGKVSKSGDTMSGTLTIQGSPTFGSVQVKTQNVDLSQSQSASDVYAGFLKNTSDQANSGKIGQLLAIQSGNDLDLMYRVANPRSGNLPSSGDGVNTGSCWAGIGTHYDYAKNLGYAAGLGLTDWDVNDSNANHLMSTSLATTRRSCYVGQAGNGVASPWFKVGTYTTTTSSSTSAVCLFDVASTLVTKQVGGQLRVFFRLNANRVLDATNTKLEWVTTYGNLNPDDFVLLFNSDSSSITLDLYVKCATSDLKYVFKVISEKPLLTGSNTSQSVFFTLANNVSNGSLAALPAGTQIKSKFKSKVKCGKRIVLSLDFKCPDYDELMSKTYKQGATNRYIWPQAANRFVKNGVEYLFVFSGCTTSIETGEPNFRIITVYNLDTGEYLGYFLITGTRVTEGFVIKSESDGDYIYIANSNNVLAKGKFDLAQFKTTITTSPVLDVNDNTIPAYWFVSYLNGTWCIDGVANRIGGFSSRTLTFYDASFKVIGAYDVQKFEQDVWEGYEGLTAEQQKIQWSIPRTQAISIGTDGIYFYKGGGTNAADTTFPITDCGVDHYNFQGDLVRSSVCRHTPFATRMLSLLGVSSNINHTECEGGYCTEDGRCFWFAVVGAQSGKLVLMEEFSDAPDAIDFSDCLANRQSNIPFQSNTPNFPRTSGGYRNPWTGELISSLDEFIKMCAIWGLDNVFISNYQAGLGTTIASTTVSSAENFGIFVRRYNYNRFFVEVIQNSLNIPRTYVVGVDSDFTVTSCTIQRTFNDGSIVTVVESGTGYKRYSDGTQECWGGGSTSSTPANVNFPKAFSSAPTVTISGETSSVDMQMRFYKAAAVSATGFTPVATNVGATAYSAVTYRYNAKGTWSA